MRAKRRFSMATACPRAAWLSACSCAASDAAAAHAQNRRNTPGRIELMKYNKYLRKYTLHREIKK